MGGVIRTPTDAEVTYAVVVATGVPLSDLLSDSKTIRLSIARFAWWRMLRTHRGMSVGEIGLTVNRDSAAVYHGITPGHIPADREARVSELVNSAEEVLTRLMATNPNGPVVTHETIERML